MIVPEQAVQLNALPPKAMLIHLSGEEIYPDQSCKFLYEAEKIPVLEGPTTTDFSVPSPVKIYVDIRFLVSTVYDQEQ